MRATERKLERQIDYTRTSKYLIAVVVSFKLSYFLTPALFIDILIFNASL